MIKAAFSCPTVTVPLTHVKLAVFPKQRKDTTLKQSLIFETQFGKLRLSFATSKNIATLGKLKLEVES